MQQYVIGKVLGENKKTGGKQVAVYLGGGSKRISVTRHISRDGMGNNPDPRAVPLHKKVDARMARCSSELLGAQDLLMALKMRYSGDTDPGTLPASVLGLTRADLAEMIIDTGRVVEELQGEMKDASSEKAHLEKELPLIVQFVTVGQAVKQAEERELVTA